MNVESPRCWELLQLPANSDEQIAQQCALCCPNPLTEPEKKLCLVYVSTGAKRSQSLDWRLAVPADIPEDHPVCIGEGAAAGRHHHLCGWSL